MLENKLERGFPTHQNAIDIFGDRWASDIKVYPGLISGPMPLFRADDRPSIAAQHLGFMPGSLQGMNILELGSLEGRTPINWPSSELIAFSPSRRTRKRF